MLKGDDFVILSKSEINTIYLVLRKIITYEEIPENYKFHVDDDSLFRLFSKMREFLEIQCAENE